MSLFDFLFGRKRPQLSSEQQARLRRLPHRVQMKPTPLSQQRFVVLDLETTGLNINRDIVISIGAVAIEDGAVQMSQQFECTLRREVKVNEAVLIHGIAPSALANGEPPADALLSFMEFAGDCVMLAFHSPFDQRMLERALKAELGYKLEHPFLDVADLAPMLFPEVLSRRTDLDHWMEYFGVEIEQRHHAAADALATAEIALILLNRAHRIGVTHTEDLGNRLRFWQRARKASLNSI